MSTEDLNLPASLERLEINPESRLECTKTDENPFSFGTTCPLGEATECSLETLSLKSVCPKGNCLCNKKKDVIGRSNTNNNNNGNSASLKSIMHHRRPIIRRSKLSREVLRAPILRLGNETEANNIGKTSAHFKKLDVTSIDSSTKLESSVLSCGQPTVNSASVQRPIYPTSTASTSYCCALQARSINNNNNSNNNNNNNNFISNYYNNTNATTTGGDDTNIDELASYFDLFVHIPKKMSVMAEMMYI